ncbi:MAG TPA: ABC transporter permease [Pirellulales bacterium]|nr:ABC transporter permease [Pirellulales bacterium]
MSRPADESKPFWRRLPGRFEAQDIAPLVSLAVLVLFFALATPAGTFLKPSTVVQILKQGSVLAIVSVGLTYVLLCAEIDLAVGMVALWTACLCGWLFERPFAAGKSGAGETSALIVAFVIAAPLLTSLLLGLVSGALTVWSRLPSFIISLAMMNIADGMSRWLTKSEKLAVPAVLKTIGNRGIEITDRLELPYSAMLAAVVFLIGHVVLQHTRFGRYVYMTGGNREAARLAGVRTGRIVIACLAISAVTAGVGGLVNAGRLNSVSLDQNADLLLSAVACVVLGGTSLFGGSGGMGRTVIGVLTFSVLKVGLNQVTWINDLARPLLMGLVLLVALVVNGLLSKEKT